MYLINYNYLNQKNIYWINDSSYDKILNFNYEILDLKTNSDYNIKIDILQDTIKNYIITIENNNKLLINNIEYDFNNNIILDNISLYFETVISFLLFLSIISHKFILIETSTSPIDNEFCFINELWGLVSPSIVNILEDNISPFILNDIL